MASSKFKFLTLSAFFAGWATFAFTLFDVGRFSITLLLLSSILVALTGFRISRQVFWPLVSFVLSLSIAWGISFFVYPESEKTFTHFFSNSLAIGVMLSAASVNWDAEFPRLRKMFAFIALIVLLYGFYQLLARRTGLPYAFLTITNQQLGTDMGLQRGYSIAGFTRVSSFFPEPSDLGRFMLWVFAMGCASRPAMIRIFLITMGIAGVLLSQSMGGLVGLAFLILAITLLKRNMRLFVVLILLFSASYGIFTHFFPQESEGMIERGKTITNRGENYLQQTQRFGSIQNHLRIILESPMIGYGLASTKRVVGDDVIVNAFVYVLLERGSVGGVLYFAPFFFALYALWRSEKQHDEITRTALFILLVEIFCFSTFNALYFPPNFFCVGVCIVAYSSSRQKTYPRKPAR